MLFLNIQKRYTKNKHFLLWSKQPVSKGCYRGKSRTDTTNYTQRFFAWWIDAERYIIDDESHQFIQKKKAEQPYPIRSVQLLLRRRSSSEAWMPSGTSWWYHSEACSSQKVTHKPVMTCRRKSSSYHEKRGGISSYKICWARFDFCLPYKIYVLN